MVPTGFRKLLTLTLLMFLVASFNAYSVDVDIVIPQVELRGELADIADLAGIDVGGELQGQLDELALELEQTIETDPDVDRFSRLQLLSEGFANAGATASHAGTPRSFIDYRAFALVFGPAVGVSAPGIDLATLTEAAENIEEEGDIYAGAAVQLFNGSLGFNISPWVPRTRAYIKVGYTDFPSGTIAEEVSFNALSLGVGGTFQLLKSRQLPLGFIRWRGLSLGSGILFQRNTTDIEITLTEQAFTTEPITLGGIGLPETPLALAGLSTDTELGRLTVTPPSITAGIESRTYSIPMEVNTGLRLLWLLDVNVGAGVDLVFGSSELSAEAFTSADFVEGDLVADQIEVTTGSARFGISSENSPEFLRPRLTAGAGLNLGPVKLDVPVMLYFDGEGNSVMAGVNVGIVW